MDIRTDERLVKDVQEGDIFAFEILVQRYQQKLFYFVSRYIKDAQASQDVVQESFIRFYKNVERIDTTKKISSYLYSIVRNAAISYLRGLHAHVSLEEIEDIEDQENIEEEFVRKEDREELRHFLSQLDNKYSRVLRLYYFDELSYQEMSNILKVPVNTVRTHLKRAKAALRTIISHEKH